MREGRNRIFHKNAGFSWLRTMDILDLCHWRSWLGVNTIPFDSYLRAKQLGLETYVMTEPSKTQFEYTTSLRKMQEFRTGQKCHGKR